MNAATAVVDEILDLFRQYGESAYDEQVTLTQHSLQTAALARGEGADSELVVAALLHDLGHLLQARARGTEDYLAADWDHDVVAGRWLRSRFDSRISTAVEQHVAAKRWLCQAEPAYLEALSPASFASLQAQGGPFERDEAAAWRRRHGTDDAIALRRWDDSGKVAGLEIAPLEDYRSLLERCCTGP